MDSMCLDHVRLEVDSMPKYSFHLFMYLTTNWQHWMLKRTSSRYEHGFALACTQVEVVYRYPFRYGICHSGAFDSPELFQYVCTITYQHTILLPSENEFEVTSSMEPMWPQQQFLGNSRDDWQWFKGSTIYEYLLLSVGEVAADPV